MPVFQFYGYMIRDLWLYHFARAFILCSLVPQSSCTTHRLHNTGFSNPRKVIFSYSDIHNFWKAYDYSAGKADVVQQKIYYSEYFGKGSIGLRDFVADQDLNKKEFIKNIDLAWGYLDVAHQNTLHVSNYQHAILSAMYKLKKIYPRARFPNIYYIVAGFISGGTVSKRAIMIGTEFWSLPETVDALKFPFNWMKNSIRTPDNIPFTAAHELLHFQQNRREFPVSLLGKCLAEGSADFVGELISGRVNNKYLYEYAAGRGKLLWLEFKKDMRTNDLSKWIYNLGLIKDRPPDLGYYIGYKICESYYNRMRIKKKAIRDIIEMNDFEKFLVMSQYDESFK